MPRQNIIFTIVAPLVLMAIIAALVIGIGEVLLTTHAWSEHLYHVGDYASAEENRYWGEISALYPVAVALGLATVFLVRSFDHGVYAVRNPLEESASGIPRDLDSTAVVGPIPDWAPRHPFALSFDVAIN